MAQTQQKKKRRARPTKARRTKCEIPPPIPIEALSNLVLSQPENVDDIASYVEWQSPGEKIVHAEKVTTEHVFGVKYECWDVRTDKCRLWVIVSAAMTIMVSAACGFSFSTRRPPAGSSC